MGERRTFICLLMLAYLFTINMFKFLSEHLCVYCVGMFALCSYEQHAKLKMLSLKFPILDSNTKLDRNDGLECFTAQFSYVGLFRVLPWSSTPISSSGYSQGSGETIHHAPN